MFKNKLQALKSKTNLSVRELATKIGVPQSTFEKWIYGVAKPNAYTQNHIIKEIEKIIKEQY